MTNDTITSRYDRVNPTRASNPAVRRRVAVLERNSGRIVQRAADDAGVGITYLGISPLFSEYRAYPGPTTDWIIAPVTDLSDAVVPRAERDKLVRLVRTGIEFPLIYIAHEIPKNQVALPAHDDSGAASPPVTVTKETASRAVGAVPAPASATTLAARLGRSSQHVLAAIGKALPVAGAIAAAPFVLAGAALGALADGLDPVVFGVIPAGPPIPGQPAAWYIIARWEWPAATE